MKKIIILIFYCFLFPIKYSIIPEYGNVIVVANSDEWLMRKKGYIFMPWEERAEILKSIKGVMKVIPVDDADGTVCDALKTIRPDIFGNGGDRNNKNTPEKAVCKQYGIEMAWGLGGTKVQSSSDLVSDSNLISNLDDDEVGPPVKRILLRGKNNEN